MLTISEYASAPPAPDASYRGLFPMADGWYEIDEAGAQYKLTNAVTGTGVVATNGYTLTLPASGTAALLEAANSFTQTNSFGAGINVGGATGATSAGMIWSQGAPGDAIAYFVNTSATGYGLAIKAGGSAPYYALDVRDRLGNSQLVVNGTSTTVSTSLNVGSAGGYGTLQVSKNINETSAMSISSTAVAKISNPNNTAGNFSLLKFSGPDNDTSVLLGSTLINAGNGDSAFSLGVRSGGGTLTEFMRMTSAGTLCLMPSATIPSLASGTSLFLYAAGKMAVWSGSLGAGPVQIVNDGNSFAFDGCYIFYLITASGGSVSTGTLAINRGGTATMSHSTSTWTITAANPGYGLSVSRTAGSQTAKAMLFMLGVG